MRLNLRAIRTARGLTIDQMAEMTGLSRGFLSQIETGKRDPGVGSLETIAQALHVPLISLIDAGSDSDLLVRAFDLFRGLPVEEQKSLVLVAEALAKKNA